MKKQHGVWSIFIAVVVVVAWFSSAYILSNGMRKERPTRVLLALKELKSLE